MSKHENLWRSTPTNIPSPVSGTAPKPSAPSLNHPTAPPKMNLWSTPSPSTGMVMPASVEAELKAEKAKQNESDEDDDIGGTLPPLPEPPRDRRKGPRKYGKIPPEQRRRACVNISVSEEEEMTLRAFADSLDISFSAWAREILFKAMGRRAPKRRNTD